MAAYMVIRQSSCRDCYPGISVAGTGSCLGPVMFKISVVDGISHVWGNGFSKEGWRCVMRLSSRCSRLTPNLS
jgi:hypothetical protein